MTSWGEVARADPELTSFGHELFEQFGIAFLATVRKDGGPRLHPVCPMILQGHLFVSITATSRKMHDLSRDGRYILHALPGSNDAEFFVRGHALQVDDPDTLSLVASDLADSTISMGRDVLFELDIELASLTVYEVCENLDQVSLKPIRRQWPTISHDPEALDHRTYAW
jgi:hypothetical protein